MITEHAVITIREGAEEEFEAAFPTGRAILAAAPGCRSVRLGRCIEEPSRYLLLVEWETLEHHTVGFRQSPAFAQWRDVVGPFFAEPPAVDHFATSAG